MPPLNKGWRARSILAGLLLIQMTLLAGGTLYQSAASAYDRRNLPAPGQLIETGEFSLHLNCTGQRVRGVPTVVLEGGLGATSLMWARVQPGVAEHTRVCSYDRAGYGWSQPGPEPRTAAQIVSELHTLLQEAGEAPPYLLVGHSFGGIVVRIYAAEHAAEVAGLILVDARHEAFFERMPSVYLQSDERNLRDARVLRLLTPLGVTRLAGTAGRLEAFETYLAPLPDDVEGAAWAMMIYNPQHWATAVSEREVIEESYRQVKAARLPDTMPLIVLTAENGAEAWRSSESPADDSARAIWMELQAEQSKLSLQSQWTILEGSGHYVHLERPEAIVDAVVSMLGD